MAEQSVTDAERRSPAVSLGAWTLALLAAALILFALVLFNGSRLPDPQASASASPAPSPATTTAEKQTVTEAEGPESRSTTTTDESSATTTTTSPDDSSTTTQTTNESSTQTLTTPAPTPTATAPATAPETGAAAPAAPTPLASTSSSSTTTTVVTSTPSPSPTVPPPTAAAGKQWDGYWSAVVAPLTGSVAFVAGGVLALFVLARLMLEIPPVRDRRSSKRDRRVLGITAVALVVGAPAALWWVGVQTQAKTLAFGILLPLVLVTLGLLGSIATAMWLASRMRLQITVENTAVTDGVAKLTREDVVSSLKALAAPSKAIEVPTGMGLDTLAASLGSLSKAPAVSAIQGLVLFIIGIVPWQVTVTQHSETEATVLIARHGRMQRSERIALTRKPYAALELVPAPTPAPQTPTVIATTTPASTPAVPPAELSSRDVLATVTAAVVLMQLREIETHDFDLALLGATSPHSVALRYIASRWFTAELQNPKGKKILDAAVTADPYNRLARWTRDWAQHRDATSASTIREYCDRLLTRLNDRAQEVGGLRKAAEDPAYTTTLMTLAAMTRNLSALTSAQMSAQDRTRATSALTKLREWSKAVSPTTANRAARYRARIDLLALDAATRAEARTRVLADRHVMSPAVEASAALSYSLACHLVRWCDVMFTDGDVVVLLARGVEDPAQRAFVQVDPELVSARDRAGFAAFRDAQVDGKPPTPAKPQRIRQLQRLRTTRVLKQLSGD